MVNAFILTGLLPDGDKKSFDNARYPAVLGLDEIVLEEMLGHGLACSLGPTDCRMPFDSGYPGFRFLMSHYLLRGK